MKYIAVQEIFTEHNHFLMGQEVPKEHVTQHMINLGLVSIINDTPILLFDTSDNVQVVAETSKNTKKREIKKIKKDIQNE